MIHTMKVAKKGGKVLCRSCGRRVLPGDAYVRIGRKNFCVVCDGPGRKAWEAPK